MVSVRPTRMTSAISLHLKCKRTCKLWGSKCSMGPVDQSSSERSGPVACPVNGNGRDVNGDWRRWSSAELTLHFSSECFGSVLSCVEFVTKGGRISYTQFIIIFIFDINK